MTAVGESVSYDTQNNNAANLGTAVEKKKTKHFFLLWRSLPVMTDGNKTTQQK